MASIWMTPITLLVRRGQRWLAHRWQDGGLNRRLPPDALARLTARVAASEQQHTGQLRLCVETGLPWSYLQRDASARERALTLFGKLRVWDTEYNNGVLIYLLLAEHAIELIADRGLNVQVNPKQWAAITTTMSQTLARESLEAGLNQAIDALTALLATHFPLEGSAPIRNELPDAPVILR